MVPSRTPFLFQRFYLEAIKVLLWNSYLWECSCRSKLLLVLLPPWRCCRLACEELSPSWKNFRLLNVYVWCRDNPGPSGVNRSKGTSAGMSAWLKIVLIKLTDRSPMDQPGRNSPSRLTRGVNQASLHLFTNVASRYKSYTRHLVY